MNALPFDAVPFILKSLSVGSLAAACVVLCPASLRSRVRLAVPVAAFVALVLLVAGLVDLLPHVTVDAPTALAGLAITGKATTSASWMVWTMWIWLGGCGLFLLRLAAGTWAVWRILNSTRPA